jgi:hypothetical protein
VALTKDDLYPAPAEPAKSFWVSFTAADMRNLIVTLVGTVLGGMLVVMAVALAVVVARWEHHRDHGVAITAFLAVVMSLGFAATVWMARDDRRWGQRATYLICCAVVLGGLALVELLALTGYAAGIK